MPNETKDPLAGRCRHFNGIMNDACKAGISYDSVRAPNQPSGTGVSMPCLPKYNAQGVTCPKYSPFTQEEVDAQEAAHKRTMELMAQGLSSCCEAPFDTSRVITSGRHKGHGPRFCSKCKRVCFMV